MDLRMIAIVFNNKLFPVIEKYWNVTYTYEADSNSINTAPKEITGLIKSLGGLNRIAIILSWSPCWRWGNCSPVHLPANQRGRSVIRKEQGWPSSKLDRPLSTKPVALVKSDVLMTVTLHLKSHLLVIGKFSAESCLMSPRTWYALCDITNFRFRRIHVLPRRLHRNLHILFRLKLCHFHCKSTYLWQQNDRYFCS